MRINICMRMSVIALVALMERCKIVPGLTADVFWLGKYQSFIQINSAVNLANNVPFHSESLAEIVSIWSGLNFPCGSYVETTGLTSSVKHDYHRTRYINPCFHVCIADNKSYKKDLRFDMKKGQLRISFVKLLQLFLF